MTDQHDGVAAPLTSVPNWGAVYAIALAVAGIITAELLPVSLLSPMATDMGITEGMAGQTVTATALVAIFSSLLISRVTRGVDRRYVVLGFSALLVVSSIIVALANNFAVMLMGRILLGVCLGGFWAMAASLTMRLVPAHLVPRALSIIFSGTSASLVIAAPLGSIAGELIGWRGVFWGAAVLGVICLVWQAYVLPPLPAREGNAAQHGILAVAKRPGVIIAMLAIFCTFAGQFSFFTYMRPYFLGVGGFDVKSFSALLLAFGVACMMGTAVAAPALRRSVRITLFAAPLSMATCAVLFVSLGHVSWLVVGCTMIWGFAFGLLPVGWSTWMTRHLADSAESAGGLQIAVVQLANTAGAAMGGIALDAFGPLAPIMLAGVLLVVTASIVWTGVRSRAEVGLELRS